MEASRRMLDDLADHDHRARSIVLRAMGIAARLAGTMDEAIGFGEQSMVQAVADGDSQLQVEALMSLAGSLAMAGKNERAIRVLGETPLGENVLLAARVDFQRGAVLSRMGEFEEAAHRYSEAIPTFESEGDSYFLAMTHHNRGMLAVAAGDLGQAQYDLSEARMIYTELELDTSVAGVEHDLGLVASYAGNIPEALRRFDASEDRHLDAAGSNSELQVSRAEVLRSAGLYLEALELAVTISAVLNKTGLSEDEAEAMLVAAQAAFAGRDYSQARLRANRASELFEAQDRDTWHSAARLVELQALFAEGDTSLELRKAAVAAAEHLEKQGQFIPAATAGMLAGRIALDHGQVEEAEDDFASITGIRTGPVELRLNAFLASALLREARGDLVGADAAARAGMNLLASYQAAIGASDIRVGIERHATELGEIGLRFALQSKTPRRVFTWMERTKARSLALRPVTPPDDEAQAADLADLRRVTEHLRLADGEEAIELSREQSALQESVRRRSRTTTGEDADTSIAAPGAVAGALGDRILVEFAEFDDKIVTIVVKNGRFYLKMLGGAAAVHKELESLRFVMRRLARGRGSEGMAEEVAERLDRELFGSLNLGDGPLVIVPTPALHATPWWALPTCRARSLTVSPSADLWMRATRRNPATGPTLVVAGPDLELSDAEVNDVADVYPKAVQLASNESEVDRVHDHLDGAGTAHIASHAFFQFENPMFSSLRLGDGDLTVYDIERLARVPDLVVLSACDSGFTDTHAGEELMGLSSALLGMGTRSIIASVGLVPDSHATKDLMVRLHEGLVSGLDPADALSKAQAAIGGNPAGFVAAASFVCIGSGSNSLYQEASKAL